LPRSGPPSSFVLFPPDFSRSQHCEPVPERGLKKWNSALLYAELCREQRKKVSEFQRKITNYLDQARRRAVRSAALSSDLNRKKMTDLIARAEAMNAISRKTALVARSISSARIGQDAERMRYQYFHSPSDSSIGKQSTASLPTGENAKDTIERARSLIENKAISLRRQLEGMGYRFISKGSINSPSSIPNIPELQSEIMGNVNNLRTHMREMRGKVRSVAKNKLVEGARKFAASAEGATSLLRSWQQDVDADRSKFALDVSSAREIFKAAIVRTEESIFRKIEQARNESLLNEESARQRLRAKKEVFEFEVRFARHNLLKASANLKIRGSRVFNDLTMRREAEILKARSVRKAKMIRNALALIHSVG
jgi:hypothetical protein